MKAKIIILSIFQICFSINCISQNMYKTTVEQENLRGKVKSLYIKGENSTYFEKWEFNEKGLLMKKETLYLLFYDYKYDKKNKLLSYKLTTKSSNTTQEYQMEYDENNFLTTRFMGNCKNDNKGNCISEERTYGEIKRKYNSKNQITEDWIYYGENYIIHSFGEDIATGEHWEKDELLSSESPHIKYQYNAQGDMIFRKKNEENKILTDTITYKYDEYGNWIEKSHTNLFQSNYTVGECEIIDYKIKRNIEYYKLMFRTFL